MKQHDAFQLWRRERDLIENEMQRLVALGLPASVEERQVRNFQFRALIERRESAARNLLDAIPRRHQVVALG